MKIGSTECSISPLVITILHKTAGFPVWLISTIPAPSHWYQWFAYIISAKIYHSATFIRGDLGLSSKKLWALTLPRNSSCPSCWSHKMCVTWSPFTMWLPYGNTKQNDQRAWCGSNLSCQWNIFWRLRVFLLILFINYHIRWSLPPEPAHIDSWLLSVLTHGRIRQRAWRLALGWDEMVCGKPAAARPK